MKKLTFVLIIFLFSCKSSRNDIIERRTIRLEEINTILRKENIPIDSMLLLIEEGNKIIDSSIKEGILKQEDLNKL